MTRQRYGYTLIEMLVVIVIISILAGLLMGALAIARRNAQIRRTEATIVMLQEAIKRYEGDYRDFPRTDSDDGEEGGEQLYEALRNRDKSGPYISGDLKTCDYDKDGRPEIRDEWHHGFRYLHPRSYGRQNPNRYSYRLWSPGPNGRSEPLEPSSDDIRNWDKAAPDGDDGD